MKTRMFEVQCSQCKHTYMVQAETLVNKKIENNYHDMLLDGSFFNRKCKHCGAIITLQYPFIYFDPETRIQLRYHMEIDDANQIAIYSNRELIECIKILDDQVNIYEILEIKKILNEKYQQNYYNGSDLNNYYFIADDQNILIKRK